MTQAARHLPHPQVARRRAEYRASYEAQRRAAADPKFVELLKRKLADLDERYPTPRS